MEHEPKEEEKSDLHMGEVKLVMEDQFLGENEDNELAGISKAAAHWRQVDDIHDRGKNHEEVPCMDNTRYGRNSHISYSLSPAMSLPYLFLHGQPVERKEHMASLMFRGGHYGEHSKKEGFNRVVADECLFTCIWLEGKSMEDVMHSHYLVKSEMMQSNFITKGHQSFKIALGKHMVSSTLPFVVQQSFDLDFQFLVNAHTHKKMPPIETQVVCMKLMFELKWNECYFFDPGIVTQVGLRGMIRSNKRVDLWCFKLAIMSFHVAVLEQQSHYKVIQLLSWIIHDARDYLHHILLQQLLQEVNLPLIVFGYVSYRGRIPLLPWSKCVRNIPILTVFDQQSHPKEVSLVLWLAHANNSPFPIELVKQPLRSKFPLCHHVKETKKDLRKGDNKGSTKEGMEVEIGGLLFAITSIPYQLDTHEEKVSGMTDLYVVEYRISTTTSHIRLPPFMLKSMQVGDVMGRVPNSQFSDVLQSYAYLP
ncbi:hypothetical protein KI387_002474 [Taxus chinensis]|uniref:Uncharacterized protein n=1 Tax=Taxus chinensis TaxID=29808 RepID=A0AA38LNM0_TAXCH|nr:hypothetical protein KI387_002474 [Taxus chinensis]